MRKGATAGVLLGLGLVVGGAARAQAPVAVAAPTEAGGVPAPGASGQPRHVLSVNPLGWLLGFCSAEYELVLGERVSVFVQPGFSRGGGNDYDLVRVPSGPYLSGGARFFLLGEAPTGLFLAPGVHGLLSTFWNSQEGRAEAWPNDSRFGADLLLGGAFRLGPRLYLSGGLGVMASVRPADANNPVRTLVLPTARANVGFAF